MNINKAEELLARYYDGLTSEAEEQALKRFFSEAEVPPHLQCDKELFLSLAAEEPEVPQGLEERLSRSIDEWERRERNGAPVRKPTRIIPLKWLGSAAACLMVFFALGAYFMMKPSAPKEAALTPEETYEYTYYALAKLSGTLNRGYEGLETVQQRTQETNETLNKLILLKSRP